MKRQRLYNANKSYSVTIPKSWLVENVPDVKKEVNVLGLSCFVVLPQKALTEEGIRELCDQLTALIPIAQKE